MTLVTTADDVWNRAAMERGGPEPREGDIAVSALLVVHSQAMSGGLLSAVEEAEPDELDAAEAGYRWLGLDAAAEVVAMVREEVEAGALDDDDRADQLEVEADEAYDRVVPTDQTLVDAFETRFAEAPEAFAGT